MWFGLFSQQLDSNSLLSILLHVKGHHGPSSYQVRLKKPNQSNQNQRLALPLALLGFPFCSKQHRKPSVPEDLVLQGLTYETIISCQPDSIKLSKRECCWEPSPPHPSTQRKLEGSAADTDFLPAFCQDSRYFSHLSALLTVLLSIMAKGISKLLGNTEHHFLVAAVSIYDDALTTYL